MSKDAVINLRIDSELKRKLQDKCYEKRLKMTEAIEQAIEQWLNEDSTQSTQDVPLSTQSTQDVPLSTQSTQDDEINQLKEDNAKLAQRLERLENKQSENYKSIARLQDTYEPYVTETKQLKEDVRTLKHETQQLKNNKPSKTDIRNLEVVLEQKIDKQQLDERLSMATMPIWESLEAIEVEKKSDTGNTNQDIVGDTSGEQIDDNPNSASQDYSSLEVVDETNNQDLGSQPTLNDPAQEHLRQLKLNQWQSKHTIIKHKTGLLVHLGYSTNTKMKTLIEQFNENDKELFSIFNRTTQQTEIWEIKSRKPHYLFCFVRVSQKKS